MEKFVGRDGFHCDLPGLRTIGLMNEVQQVEGQSKWASSSNFQCQMWMMFVTAAELG